MAQFNITADSVPVVGWIPSNNWTVTDWVKWFNLNVDAYGKDPAVQKFVAAYNDAPPFSNCINWRSFDDTFIQFAHSNGFYDQLFPGIAGSLARLISGGRNVITNTATTAENITQSAAKASEWILYVVLFAALAIGIYFVYHKFIKD